MESALRAVTRFLRGEPVDIEGGRSMRHARPVPVWMAAGGPRTLRMCGRVADGVFIRVGRHPDNVRHAVQQVRDYRRWLDKNANYFRDQTGALGVEAGTTGIVVIGRSAHRENELGADRLRDLRREGVEVMSYDRILRHAEGQVAFREKSRKDIDELRKTLEARKGEDNPPSSH